MHTFFSSSSLAGPPLGRRSISEIIFTWHWSVKQSKEVVGGFKVSVQVEESFGLLRSFACVLLASCWVFTVPGLSWLWFCALPDHDLCHMWPMVMFLLNCTRCALVNLGTLCFHARCRRTDDTWPSIKLVWREQMIPDLAQDLSL